MPHNIFFVSDTHFSHERILTFKDENNINIRQFSSVEEMDEIMIERWNGVVKPGDRVYHHGDVSFDYDKLATIMPRLNGSKRLLIGNHDDPKDNRLNVHFKKIGVWRLFKDHKIICTHIPILPSSFPGGAVINIHGHIHGQPDPSPQHMNICVEKTNYTPLALEEITARF